MTSSPTVQKLRQAFAQVSESNTQIPLSNRTVNRLGEVLKAVSFQCSQSAQSVNLSEFSELERGVIQRDLPTVLKALVNKSFGIRQVDSPDLGAVLQLLSDKLGREESFDDVIVTIGFGGSESLPSVRTPAYLVPAIRSLQELSGLAETAVIKNLPKVRVFQANHMGSFVNQFNLQKTLATSRLSFLILQSFLDRFFPVLKAQFLFESDNNWLANPEFPEPLAIEIARVAEEIRQIPLLQDVVELCEKMGSKHGGVNGAQKALFYAAAHSYYNQSLISPKIPCPISNYLKESKKPSLIIDHGGRPQAPFNKITSVLSAHPSSSHHIKPPLLNVITAAGKIPVYYQARNGDLLVGSDIPLDYQKQVDLLTMNDYELLFWAVGKEAYCEFIADFNRQHANVIQEVQNIP